MSKPDIEQRSTRTPVEVRSATSRTIGGMASVYSKPSRLLGGSFLEVIEPRAWARSAGNGWPYVAAYREHKPELLLGTIAAGTLGISDTRDGLDYTINLADTTVGNDTLADVTAGNLRGSSVSMRVHQDEYTHTTGYPVRHVISAELLDVSVVSNPAYADATCALRSFAAQHGVDPDELLANVAAGNVDLRGYYTRTDLAVAATPMVEPAVSHRIPTPDEVRASYGIEARAETGEAEIQRKLLAHIMKKHAWNAPHQASGADVLDLARRRHALNENGEQRSSAVATVESRTARGHLIAIGESDVHDYGRW